jgi:hypothetical protein
MMPILPGQCDTDENLEIILRWAAKRSGEFVLASTLTLADQQLARFQDRSSNVVAHKKEYLYNLNLTIGQIGRMIAMFPQSGLTEVDAEHEAMKGWVNKSNDQSLARSVNRIPYKQRRITNVN